jgi:hypothetical protein
MNEFDSLIPEMRDWNNGAGIDVNAWVGCTGNFCLAVGYSTVFWPRLVEFEGYVLHEGFSVDSLRGFEQSCGSDRQQVEAVMNHRHIADIQYYGCEDITRERIVYLGRILREIYSAKLAWQFPERRFEVVFNEDGVEHLTNYEVTFFQKDIGVFLETNRMIL